MKLSTYNRASQHTNLVMSQMEALQSNPEHVALMQRLANEREARYALHAQMEAACRKVESR